MMCSTTKLYHVLENNFEWYYSQHNFVLGWNQYFCDNWERAVLIVSYPHVSLSGPKQNYAIYFQTFSKHTNHRNNWEPNIVQ